jgi:hypothetical protein
MLFDRFLFKKVAAGKKGSAIPATGEQDLEGRFSL